MIHKSTLENYPGTLPELAEALGDLRYDALAKFLQFLADKIEQDAIKDASRGRMKLAGNLFDCAGSLRVGQGQIERAWEICEPYM